MTLYAFTDASGITRLEGTLDPDPSGGEVPIGPAGGDLAGTYPDPTIKAIGAAAGPVGDATHVAATSINTKGQVTALTSVAITYPVSTVFTRAGAVTAQTGDYSVAQVTGAAPLASPTLTGVPAAPTAVKGTTTTQLATTAFVGNILVSGSGAPSVFVAPLYYDTTAVTGGLYAWNGAAYVHVSAVV